MIMRGSSMHTAEHHFKDIMYPGYGTHHILEYQMKSNLANPESRAGNQSKLPLLAQLI